MLAGKLDELDELVVSWYPGAPINNMERDTLIAWIRLLTEGRLLDLCK